MDQRYGTEVWNGSFKEVWNGGMERVWSRSLFRTSYFDLPPYVCVCVIIYGHKNPMIYLQHLLLWFLLLWSLLSHDPIVCFTPSSSGRNIWSGSKE